MAIFKARTLRRREVRRHIRHLSEGTQSFEIEYQKQLEAVKDKYGLS